MEAPHGGIEMHQIRTFEDLRNHVYDEKINALECLSERLEELTEFQRGSYHGEVMTYDNLLHLLQNILKYGEDVD